ncbi:sodium ion-translocating decarboxylase subunit beta [Tepidibacter formicigenes]|jgi:oxaloacetate decarboxylase beta subunit|uniref:Oxaloacetate decarboxylase, beta subunit n=1 Tax=Tepidibacter formicigenes DSM 15518 TaxID=1123349 RepID=A0A1M6RVA3_9FIRM|nr:sodium ion-translocating decarboxylase subunit beta [Tepidibacter formicigenes]SHK36350.1 oxaloacetate decarboxylase, beta subunit [Tepidibacter formicigenes DSM 15518]
MGDIIFNFVQSTGIYNIIVNWGDYWQQVVMILIACILLYLAISKGFEPLLLVPIAFGMILTNLPLAGLMAEPETLIKFHAIENQEMAIKAQQGIFNVDFITKFPGGLLNYLFKGDELGIFPPLIFMGVGAMTDFGPLIANPKSLLLGAAAQFGIFFTFIGAIILGFDAQAASSIGIIGGADGPTAIFLATKLKPELLGPIAVAAYSYMALVPIIQPPIMKVLTTKEEREIQMEQLRPVSKKEKIIFPILVTILVSLILPPAATLIGMLMLGNLFRECGVTDRLSKTATNELINIVTIFLGLSVGATAKGENFLVWETIKIFALGVIAFGIGTASGVLLAKLLNKFLKKPINPLIGAAGVSAVPMAARVANKVGQEENPSNFLLMHAMGPNVSGVIGSAVAAGVLLSLFG